MQGLETYSENSQCDDSFSRVIVKPRGKKSTHPRRVTFPLLLSSTQLRPDSRGRQTRIADAGIDNGSGARETDPSNSSRLITTEKSTHPDRVTFLNLSLFHFVSDAAHKRPTDVGKGNHASSGGVNSSKASRLPTIEKPTRLK